jgi:hypothetical protein
MLKRYLGLKMFTKILVPYSDNQNNTCIQFVIG